jgi:hypothetical protein
VPGRRPPRRSSAVDVPVAKRSRRRWWTLSAIVVLSGAAGLGVVRSTGRAGGAHNPAMPAEPLPLGPPAAVGALKSSGSAGATGPEGVPVPAGRPLASPRTSTWHHPWLPGSRSGSPEGSQIVRPGLAWQQSSTATSVQSANAELGPNLTGKQVTPMSLVQGERYDL